MQKKNSTKTSWVHVFYTYEILKSLKQNRTHIKEPYRTIVFQTNKKFCREKQQLKFLFLRVAITYSAGRMRERNAKQKQLNATFSRGHGSLSRLTGRLYCNPFLAGFLNPPSNTGRAHCTRPRPLPFTSIP